MATAQNRIITPEICIKDKWLPAPLEQAMKLNPQTQFGHALKAIFRHLKDTPYAREAAAELIDRLSSIVVCESRFWARIHRGPLWLANNGGPAIEDHGMVGYKVVTTAGAAFVIDAWQNLVELENMKFMGIGTGTGAEAAADTSLGTELTTEYNPNNTRAAGALSEGATPNIVHITATNTLDGTPGAAIREMGVFSNATVGSGSLFDRTLYISPGYALVSGDGLETPYEWSMTTGG